MQVAVMLTVVVWCGRLRRQCSLLLLVSVDSEVLVCRHVVLGLRLMCLALPQLQKSLDAALTKCSTQCSYIRAVTSRLAFTGGVRSQ